MALSIRPATLEDSDALVEMRSAFSLEEEPLGGLRPDYETDMRSYLAEGLGSGRLKGWLVELDGEVVAHAFLVLVDKLPRPTRANRRIAYLTNVYTRPSERGAGIGADLLATVTSWAESSDVEVIFVGPSDVSTAFYARSGFAPPPDLLVWEAAPARLG